LQSVLECFSKSRDCLKDARDKQSASMPRLNPIQDLLYVIFESAKSAITALLCRSFRAQNHARSELSKKCDMKRYNRYANQHTTTISVAKLAVICD
jgi:hypothetical protein